MALLRRLFLVLSGLFLTPGALFAQFNPAQFNPAQSPPAQAAIRWETSIDGAKQTAAQTKRLVLVVFTAPQWCIHCRELESDLNSQPGIGQAIEANYVPVKINSDYFPNTAKQYNVKTLPTTIVLAPTAKGEVLDVIPERMPLDQYLARLNRVAADMRRRTPVVAQMALPPGSLPPGNLLPGNIPQGNTQGNGVPPGTPMQLAMATNRPLPPTNPFDAHSDLPNVLRPAMPPPNNVSSNTLSNGNNLSNTNNAVVAPIGPPIASQFVAPSVAGRMSGPMNGPNAGPNAAFNGGFNAAPNNVGPNNGAPGSIPQRGVPQGNVQQVNAQNMQPTGLGNQPVAFGNQPLAGDLGVRTTSPPSPRPQYGFDGFCPVSMMEHAVWQPGDKAWGAIHRGRTYLFAGEDERRRFMADPDRYAPVHSGIDIVLEIDQQKSFQGEVAHGGVYRGHVYLFADEASYERFISNPQYYADRAAQPSRPTTQTAAQ